MESSGVPRSIKDSSGHGNHGRVINPDHYRMGLAPIFGEGASGHLDGESYLEFGTVRTFGREFHKGFYLGLDIQPEADSDLALCGTGVTGKTSLRVFLRSSGNKSYTLQVEIRDDAGRSLSAFTELSEAPAKRLLISVFPPKSEVSFSEITLHEDRVNLQPTYIDRQDPSQFSALPRPFIIGGFNADGSKHGEFVGRLACIFLNQGHPMSADHLRNLVAASRDDLKRFNGVRPKIPESNERRNVFRDDLLKLRGWHKHRHLSDSDMKDASVVLYKWLCDRRRLLQDLCDELGIQLSFPGESDSGRAYNEVITKDKPVYAQPIRIGTQSIFGFKWVPLKQFLSDMAFVTDGHPVSHDAFVKFVRHKLGGCALR